MPTFPTPAPIAARLDLPSGTVEVLAGDRADTVVEIAPADPARSRDAKAAEGAAVSCADGVLRIEVPAGNRYVGATGSVRAAVRLPAGSGLEIRSSSVRLRTRGRLGDVAVTTDHGDLDVDAAAAARLATSAGDIAVGRLAGPGEIRTSSGAITVTEAVSGDLALRTDSGHITVGAARGVSASLDAGTAAGRVVNELKNDGTTRLAIRATTADGDITARSL